MIGRKGERGGKRVVSTVGVLGVGVNEIGVILAEYGPERGWVWMIR